ncbi:MAG: glycosyltransferase family 2 protein [Nitrospinaceae bacterium]
MPDIQYHPRPVPADARFSILIPTWNNLDYLRLCLQSLRKNSRHPHQILLHINEGTDGTLACAGAEELAFTYSPRNVGICYAVNAAATLAQTDYILYLNDDMYVCPGWDEALWKEIEALEPEPWFLAATLIEPAATGNPCVIAADYGSTVETFREKDLLNGFAALPMGDQQSPGGCANVVPRWLWRRVGGYSTELTPGWNSDPDFAMKLWQAGVRRFKTIAASRVYHFHNRTGRRVGPRGEGRRRFAAKWGLTSSKFMKHYLRLGQPYAGRLEEPAPHWELTLARWRSRLPGLFR